MSAAARRTGALAGLHGMLALAAVLVAVGCGQRGDDTQADGDGEGAAQGGPEAAGPAGGAPATFTARGGDLQPTGGQGRLPGDGDRAIYIPATDLFPGSARLDPGIENPLSGDPQAEAAGERHYSAFNCDDCHAPLGGGGMGPPLSDDSWIYGSEPAQIYLSIMHGRPEGMPAWSSMLPQQTAWELVAYIETLSRIEDPAAEKGFASSGSRAAPSSSDPEDEAHRAESNR